MKALEISLTIFTFLLLSYGCAADEDLVGARKRETLQRIFNGYDPDVRPVAINGTGGGVQVEVDMYLRSFEAVDDQKMEFRVQITLREKWFDGRLKYDHLRGPGEIKYLETRRPVWMPDIFFTDEKKGHRHDLLVPNSFIRIYPDGHVFFSTRVTLNLFCPMNFQMYPFDEQSCPIRIATYESSTDDVTLLWRTTNPIQLPSTVYLPLFNIDTYAIGYCSVRTYTGEYSCLSVDFWFQRDISNHLLKVFLPCAMLVCVSWVSMFADKYIRGVIALASLLSMAHEISRLNASMPVVAYVKAIDIYTGVCLMFAFYAFVEGVNMDYMLRNHDKQKDETENQEEDNAEDETKRRTDVPFAMILQRITRVSFPIFFGLFSVAFWLLCTIGQGWWRS